MRSPWLVLVWSLLLGCGAPSDFVLEESVTRDAGVADRADRPTAVQDGTNVAPDAPVILVDAGRDFDALVILVDAGRDSDAELPDVPVIADAPVILVDAGRDTRVDLADALVTADAGRDSDAELPDGQGTDAALDDRVRADVSVALLDVAALDAGTDAPLDAGTDAPLDAGTEVDGGAEDPSVTCARLTSCGACLAHPPDANGRGCGWCAHAARCLYGDATGVIRGICEGGWRGVGTTCP